MVNAENITNSISGLGDKIIDLLSFWKNWPSEAKIMLVICILFLFLSLIILTYGMKIHGLDWHDAKM